LKTHLAKSIFLKVKTEKSRFPKFKRSKSLKVVAKAFEEPNMHKCINKCKECVNKNSMKKMKTTTPKPKTTMHIILLK
jgi:hypothetical protein